MHENTPRGGLDYLAISNKKKLGNGLHLYIVVYCEIINQQNMEYKGAREDID